MSASIIASLVISGSRNSDGTANASGKVWAYLPDTSTTTPLYGDPEATVVITQPIILDQGGRIPTATAPDGIFTSKPIRLYIEDADGVVVSDSLFYPATAATVSIDNESQTAATIDVSLTNAKTSFGGDDWKYLIALGQTPLNYKDVVTQLSINVKAFGATGNGAATDTTWIQNALNFLKEQGGGTLLLPPGDYKTDLAITATDADGITILGAGADATRIIATHATADAFTFANCDSLVFRNISIAHASATTGAAIRVTDSTRPLFENTVIGDDGTFRYGLYLDGCLGPEVITSSISADPADAAGRGIYALDCGTLVTVGKTIQALAGYAVELDGSSQITALGTVLGQQVRFAATFTGSFSTFVGTSMSLEPSIGTATIPYMRYLASGLDASATSSATGAAQTPSLIAGKEIILTAASGGAGVVTVNAPALLPPTGASFGVDLYYDFVFKNAAGGAVTWTTNAIYVLVGGVAIPGVDGTTVSVRFRWDRTTSKLRECYRAVTTT